MDQLKLSKENFKNSKDFILTNARMIERRLFHHEFENDFLNSTLKCNFTSRQEG